jgi:hypothetical protein
MRFFGASMDKDTWNSLTDNGKKTWDDLTPEDKSKILNYASKRGSDSGTGKSDGKQKATLRPKKKISANVHDTDDGADDSEIIGDDGESKSVTFETNVHDTVQEAKSKAHPADVRMMMSSAKKPGSTKSDDSGKATIDAKATDVKDSLTEYLADYWESQPDFQ